MMDGWGMSSWGWGWMSLTFVVSIVVIVLLVVLIIRVSSPRSRPETTDPEEILARRFAEGEIEEDEYWQRLNALEAGAVPPGERAA